MNPKNFGLVIKALNGPKSSVPVPQTSHVLPGKPNNQTKAPKSLPKTQTSIKTQTSLGTEQSPTFTAQNKLTNLVQKQQSNLSPNLVPGYNNIDSALKAIGISGGYQMPLGKISGSQEKQPSFTNDVKEALEQSYEASLEFKSSKPSTPLGPKYAVHAFDDIMSKATSLEDAQKKISELNTQDKINIISSYQKASNLTLELESTLSNNEIMLKVLHESLDTTSAKEFMDLCNQEGLTEPNMSGMDDKGSIDHAINKLAELSFESNKSVANNRRNDRDDDRDDDDDKKHDEGSKKGRWNYSKILAGALLVSTFVKSAYQAYEEETEKLEKQEIDDGGLEQFENAAATHKLETLNANMEEIMAGIAGVIADTLDTEQMVAIGDMSMRRAIETAHNAKEIPNIFVKNIKEVCKAKLSNDPAINTKDPIEIIKDFNTKGAKDGGIPEPDFANLTTEQKACWACFEYFEKGVEQATIAGRVASLPGEYAHLSTEFIGKFVGKHAAIANHNLSKPEVQHGVERSGIWM